MHPEYRHEFLGRGDELNYLSDMVKHYASLPDPHSQELISWLHRFRSLLNASGKDDGSIMLQDHWAAYFEATGDYQEAAFHREREVELIQALFQIDGPVGSVDERFLANINRLLEADRARLKK